VISPEKPSFFFQPFVSTYVSGNGFREAVKYGLNVEAVLKLRLYLEPTKKSFAEELKKQRADHPRNNEAQT